MEFEENLADALKKIETQMTQYETAAEAAYDTETFRLKVSEDSADFARFMKQRRVLANLLVPTAPLLVTAARERDALKADLTVAESAAAAYDAMHLRALAERDALRERVEALLDYVKNERDSGDCLANAVLEADDRAAVPNDSTNSETE